MFTGSAWPLLPSLLVFLGGFIIIGLAGPRLARLAETLAVRTGLGQAISGALFLGASTSLPGIVTSVTAAAEGHASLAMSNAFGGIAAQTAFLAIADVFHRRANLEHAAASPSNIFQGGLLVALLAMIVMAASGPDVTLLGVHPATPLLFIGYAFGMRIAAQTHVRPMWTALRTSATQIEDTEARHDGRTWARLWTEFVLTGAATGAAGWAVARAGVSVAADTGISESVVGGLFTAVTTSLPELVTAIAAVRRGALALAVGDIIGGNAFDTLFAGAADVAYRRGSVYHAMGMHEMFLLGLSLLMTSILIMGLLRRERSGIAGIGLESFLILVLYLTGFAILGFGSG